jgi:hypothetical protein
MRSFLIALMCFLAFAPAECAQAGPVHGTLHIPSAEFAVAASNGYSIYVKSEREDLTLTVTDRRPPQVFVSRRGAIVSANTGNVAANTYRAYDSVPGARGIGGQLGSFGNISVVFRPSGKVRVTKLKRERDARRCTRPAKIVRHLGTFTGTIRFMGENGFTSVDLSTAAGSVGTSPTPSCSDVRHSYSPPSGPIYGRESSVFRSLRLAAVDGGGPTTGAAQFSAVKTAAGVDYRASGTDEFAPHLFVYRVAQAVGLPTSFHATAGRNFAAVSPPAPFFGQAVFQPNDLPYPANEWSGSLGVSFPGIDVPLAGPAFTAELMRASS